ncbi:putative WD-40 repeat protein [Gregarina niphandrodes]|uniref:WD-40 repeat protein n=1 Tax=Gregarina niphandrodes TaxID=110365 RepID=A0A023BDM8_GRENI|nr:putative WD-40 repeat protein [Gregarina niphandrodes]EZG89687.1 putative WD-40 repeat protein [Gregarina niphandrodes]|eukprot:XP_011128461.1 putative WD-40 repeat protein [Gregarina niphandrodes]
MLGSIRCGCCRPRRRVRVARGCTFTSHLHYAYFSVIRIVLQFLYEQRFERAFDALQLDSGIGYGIVASKSQFIEDVGRGDVPKLIDVCGKANLPEGLVTDVLTHVCLELLSSDDMEGYEELLSKSNGLRKFSEEEKAGMQRVAKEMRPEDFVTQRRVLAEKVAGYLEEMPASRLLSIIGESLKRGGVDEGAYDLCRSMKGEGGGYPPMSPLCDISFQSEVTSVSFSPDGRTLAVGMVNGRIELYLWKTGKLREELGWTTQLVWEHSLNGQGIRITALKFSPDGLILASGDEKGNVKLWQVENGRLGQKIVCAHTHAINSIEYHPKNQPVLLTASNDGTAKILQIRSATTSLAFTGHEGFVTAAIFSGKFVITGCTDSLVRVFALKSGALIKKFNVPTPPSSNRAVTALYPHPHIDHAFYISTPGNACCLATTQGLPLHVYSCEHEDDRVLAACPQGNWLMVLIQNRTLLAIDPETNQVHATQQLSHAATHLAHNPVNNVLAIWAGKSLLVLD